MSRVIVYDQMQVQVLWGLLINQGEKLDPLWMAVAVHAGSNDASLGHLQASEQGSRSVTLVIVGHRAQASLDQGQSRLGPVQRLNRRFLVGAQHQGGADQLDGHRPAAPTGGQLA